MTTQNSNAATPLQQTAGAAQDETKQSPVVELPGKKKGKKDNPTPDEMPPLEDRLLRLSELFELQTKYDRLNQSLQKLASFKLKNGSENISITLKDEQSREYFTTSNAAVVKEIMDCLTTTILQKKKELEPKLVW